MRRLVLLFVLLLGSSASAAVPRAPFAWPLAGSPVVDRGFEPPRTDYGPGHRGVDLRARVGDPVFAAGAGRVSYAGLLAGRGVVTVVHAGGLRTTYEPLSVRVHVGDAVLRGGLLGKLTTGHGSCRIGTTCLHWGLLRGNTYLDPLSLLGQGPLRLLPLGDRPTAGYQAIPRSDVRVVAHRARAQAARSTGSHGRTARALGAVAAVASLVGGTALLAGRGTSSPRSGPPPPSAPLGSGGTEQPVDLLAERRRRRAG